MALPPLQCLPRLSARAPRARVRVLSIVRADLADAHESIVMRVVFLFCVGSVHSNGLPSIFTNVNTPEGGSFIYGASDNVITNEFWRMCNASLYTQAMEEFADLDLGTNHALLHLARQWHHCSECNAQWCMIVVWARNCLCLDCLFLRLSLCIT